MQTLSLRSTQREELIDITDTVRHVVRAQGWRKGMLLLYCPHTTGALAVNEHADPDVRRDIAINMGKLVPRQGDYRHAEGNSDAHIKTSLLGPAQMLIVEDGEIMLGTWQGIYFCEFDGPRQRSLWAQFVG